MLILTRCAFAAEAGVSRDRTPIESGCDSRLVVRGVLDPGLTDTEKKLLCGGGGAWATLPFSQLQFNLRNFLQERGYLNPVFVQQLPGTRMTVDIGEPTRVTRLVAVGAPEGLRLHRKRKILGEVLTPRLLGEVEQWVTQRLGALGHACSQVTARGDPATGVITVQVDVGMPMSLASVLEDPIPGVQHGMIRRYDAFGLGELYNGDLMTVTSNRISSLRILQATYFTTRCEGGVVTAHQEVSAGPPRFLTFGVGIDTEGVVRLRASWRNARLGNHASYVETMGEFTAREQTLNFVLNWYNLPFPSRRYLRPSFRLGHENQNAFEVISTRAAFQLATSWDRTPLGAEVFVGPVLELVRTLRGSGIFSPNSRFVELEAVVRARSHSFEYWATDPRAGYVAAMTTTLASDALGSTASAQRFELTGEALWNYRDYDPPLWILGVRWGLRTVFSSERPGFDSRLPASFYSYLGGSRDLRGFSLQSLPDLGAMTSMYVDPEFRLTDLPLFGVQPFFFVDLGFVGRSPAAFDSPLLYSPGAGLRYKSPFGVFRTTIARGFPLDTPGGWNFYFSFGEEF